MHNQSDARQTGDQEVVGSILAVSGKHSSIETDYEIFSTVILTLQLIHEGQLSSSGEKMCTSKPVQKKCG